MSDRFSDLTKTIDQPAARLLAMANVKLETKLEAAASAPVEVVLNELGEKNAPLDLLRVFSVALPPRERIWWACLAGRDIVAKSDAKASPTLSAAETWVFKPTDANRSAAQAALDIAELEDEAQLCCTAVAFFDDTLGPDDLAKYPAPPGASQMAAFGVNMKALALHADTMDVYVATLIERATDIARGGNGLKKPMEDA